jgi:hypothetical protein
MNIQGQGKWMRLLKQGPGKLNTAKVSSNMSFFISSLN